MTKVVVGLELQQVGPDAGTFLVLGLLVFFETHVQRFATVEACADALWQWPLEPTRVPQGEGWESVGDLPRSLWFDLCIRIYALRRARIDTEAWEAAGTPTAARLK